MLSKYFSAAAANMTIKRIAGGVVLVVGAWFIALGVFAGFFAGVFPGVMKRTPSATSRYLVDRARASWGAPAPFVDPLRRLLGGLVRRGSLTIAVYPLNEDVSVRRLPSLPAKDYGARPLIQQLCA